ncbi:MAG: cellulase family glycosylhydrolase [Bacteroidetes bacterium]|nr:cellulase family glycosylhydrolase [Bacteroidota bacterium]
MFFLTATEHYGSVMNRPFRYERYLADAAAKGIAYTRLFLLFRELQSATNPYSTCKPESPDYISPFQRTGPGKALDGELKYDLDKWNPEFFSRLQKFLDLASYYGIVVELTLLSNTYEPDVWALNPVNADNNINGMEKIEWPGYITMRNPKIFDLQKKYVRKIIEFTKRYDNVIYEVCNEPGGNLQGNNKNAQPPEVNQWLMQIADVISDAEKDMPNKHLVVGEEAYNDSPWQQTSDSSFRGLKFDVVNIHPLPNTTYHGKSYDMGEFMSKQLKLKTIRDYCLATYNEAKPLNFDEDNVASEYKDYEGWTIDRKRAWVTLFSGAHYDLIDFSIINYSETGTDSSQKYLRSWFKNLSAYMHSVDIVKAKPIAGWLKEKPGNLLEIAFVVPGKDYNIYLADERELTDKDAGKVIRGDIRFDLPEGKYEIRFYSPETGLYSPGIKISGAKNLQCSLPEINGDIVIRISKVD